MTYELSDLGWTCLRLWESDILRDPEAAADRVVTVLESLRQSDR